MVNNALAQSTGQFQLRANAHLASVRLLQPSVIIGGMPTQTFLQTVCGWSETQICLLYLDTIQYTKLRKKAFNLSVIFNSFMDVCMNGVLRSLSRRFHSYDDVAIANIVVLFNLCRGFICMLKEDQVTHLLINTSNTAQYYNIFYAL